MTQELQSTVSTEIARDAMPDLISLRVQSLVFAGGKSILPHENATMAYYFYRPVFDADKDCYILGSYNYIEFTGYFNLISWKKLQTFTTLIHPQLYLKIKGRFRITLFSFVLNNGSIDRKNFLVKEFNCENCEEVRLDYPENQNETLAFSLESLSDCEIYDGGYYAEAPQQEVNETRLALASTTFRREEYITRNANLIKQEILSGDDEIASNFRMFIVDNGQTLDPSTFQHDAIQVFPNQNVGGAGGFSRGMIEALESDFKPTHILLMDDDVMIMPESIRRLYTLQRVIRPEYRDHLIGGAMLRMDHKNVQHESLARFGPEGHLLLTRPSLPLDNLFHCIINDYQPMAVETADAYAAWWFCCIPTTVARLDNLPIPVFIRGDDIEYSLRNDAKILAFNGLCVWHEAFEAKYSNFMDLYQPKRNFLILQAAGGKCPEHKLYEHLQRAFREELWKYNYSGAEILLDALDDFLKGPEFLETLDCTEQLKKQSAKNEKYTPISQIEYNQINMNHLYGHQHLPTVLWWIFRFTDNGHRFIPRFLRRNSFGYMAFNHHQALRTQFLRNRILMVNPFNRSRVERVFDGSRGRELIRRYQRLSRQYEREHEALVKAYRERFKVWTGVEFWKKYLGI